MTVNVHLARFFRHSAVYATGNIINRAGAFLLLPLYTNHLSVAEYGSLELLYVGMAIISGVLSVGLAHATLRFYFEFEEISDRNALISTNLIASFVISTIGILALAPWSGLLSEIAFGSDGYTVSIYLLLATIVLELSSQVSLAYLRAIERSGLFVSIAFVKLIVQVVANTYLVLVENAGVQGIVLGNLVTVFVGWLILTVFTIRHCGFKFHGAKAGPVLRYSYPFLLSTLVGLVSNNTDRMLITGVLGLQALGVYALAIKFSILIQELICEPFNRAYGSFRFSIMREPDAGKIQARIVRYFLVVEVTAGLAISYFVGDVLRLVSAAEYWPASNIVPILLLASVIGGLSYPMQTGILINKQPRKLFYNSVIVALVWVSANFALVPVIGLTGACVSLLLSAVLNVVLTNYVSQRYFTVRYEYRRWLALLLIALVYFCLGFAASHLSGLTSLVAKITLLLAFIATVMWSPVFDRYEVDVIKKFCVGVISRKKPAVS